MFRFLVDSSPPADQSELSFTALWYLGWKVILHTPTMDYTTLRYQPVNVGSIKNPLIDQEGKAKVVIFIGSPCEGGGKGILASLLICPIR